MIGKILESAQLLADRALCEIELLSSECHAAGLDDGQECARDGYIDVAAHCFVIHYDW